VTRISFRPLVMALPIVAMTLSSCGRAPELRVNDAVVILSPVDSNPAALYFTIHGGPEKVYLNSVLSRSVIRSEVHESKVDPKTGMVTMEPTRKIEIPAKGTVEFKRGGKHVMLWGVNRPARQLKELEAEFIFSNGDRIIVDAEVRAATAGDADKKDAHSGH
jgi:copper(I)-binding protein